MKRSMWTVLAAIALAPAAGRAQCDPVWSGLNGGADWEVRALATFDEDGPGPLPPALFAGGGFLEIAGIESFVLTRWNGWSASSVGDGLVADFSGIECLLPISAGAGQVTPGLYVGGEIDGAGGSPVNNIARWFSPQWRDVGGGVTSIPESLYAFVWAMAPFDEDGEGPLAPAIFVGGQFERAGGAPAEGLARWDGARWSDVGGSLDNVHPATRPTVKAIAVYDDGRGPALYVGGSFDFAGGERVHNIARWDGVRWESVGPGVNASVKSLCVFDEDGPGPKRPALFAGGSFTSPAGGAHGDLYHIGRWDGTEWTEVGGWLSDGSIKTMLVWDEDGPGPMPESLYVGGAFNILPDLTRVNHIARWDGAQWHDVGGGVSGFGAGTGLRGMAVFDEDGAGPNPGGLYVGGLFYRAGGVETHHIARWGCPLGPRRCYADCDESGALDFLDFLCFQNAFAAAALSADCDQSATLDFFDFLCFQNAFAAGCS